VVDESGHYPPIANHGIVGDMHTAALVGLNGSVDWMCYPDFDSPSVFAAILDAHKGGHFRIRPLADEVSPKQFYWPDTNVLVTRFLSSEGVGEIIDYMPVANRLGREHRSALVRHVRVVRGRMHFDVDCQPRFDYARARHQTSLVEGGAVFHAPELRLGLATDAPLEVRNGGVGARLVLEDGQHAVFILRSVPEGASCGACMDAAEATALFHETVAFWRRWVSHCTYAGRWREQVCRSALALKLLTHEPSGAIIAAPTTSLPEFVGGVRNWDYRFTWIRDAAFTVYGLLRIGFAEEAGNFMRWIEARCHERERDGSLRIMYGIDGRHELPEIQLDHLEGFRGSGPVRIGNGAHDQLQLDIYGALLDAAYLYNKYGTPISYDLWRELRGLVNWVCDNWEQPDDGVWEMRAERRHFVYSKLMCWVAVDRALRLADKRSFPADRRRWEVVRDHIYEDLLKQGFSADRGAFVQRYGDNALDASNLIMPLVFFMSPNDPRMLATIDEIRKPPSQGGLTEDGLVYRYDQRETEDGLPGAEGSFNLCSFWLVEALTRAGRVDPERLEQARHLFELMLGYANHLGLYAEETGPCGEALGNFPQAFTHLALISAAYNLDRTLG
jgi:GH15 family glucan-1,4-alpha-glucosidase